MSPAARGVRTAMHPHSGFRPRSMTSEKHGTGLRCKKTYDSLDTCKAAGIPVPLAGDYLKHFHRYLRGAPICVGIRRTPYICVPTWQLRRTSSDGAGAVGACAIHKPMATMPQLNADTEIAASKSEVELLSWGKKYLTSPIRSFIRDPSCMV
jgi:hypothetical protein